jgi:hypothetical protein
MKTMTTTTTTCSAVPVTGGSCAAAVIKAGVELSKADLQDALTFASYGWAVQTRYLGATNTQGSRIKAGFADRGSKGSRTVSYQHELDGMQNHLAAAMAFLNGLDNGCREYKLVAVFSNEKGYLFSFR